MTRIKITLTIEPPISLVFQTITDGKQYSQVVPEMKSIKSYCEKLEYLSSIKRTA